MRKSIVRYNYKSYFRKLKSIILSCESDSHLQVSERCVIQFIKYFGELVTFEDINEIREIIDQTKSNIDSSKKYFGETSL